MEGFTKEEALIMEKLVDAHNLYVKLESTHPSDIHDWVTSLHNLQNILSMRILQRDYPLLFPTKKNN